jgi:hypothetical protein
MSNPIMQGLLNAKPAPVKAKKSTLNTDILDQILVIQIWTRAIVHQRNSVTPDQRVMDKCQRRIDDAKQDILNLVAGEIK